MGNSNVVLDASAVLAYLQEEKGCTQVEKVLSEGDAIISSANYAEVVTKLIDIDMREPEIRVVLENLEMTIKPVDENQAWYTGMLRQKTKRYGLSLGDRACIALAESLNLPILTTDKQWDKVDTPINITQLR
jgi:ribonuclease VapC